MTKMSELELMMLADIRAAGLPEPQQEYRFHKVRKWRFDFAWPDLLIAVECEGGTWSGGRHTSGKGYRSDCEKYNAAGVAGWLVLRYTRGMIESRQAIAEISEAIRRANDGSI